MTNRIVPAPKTTGRSFALPLGLGIISVVVIIMMAPVVLNMLKSGSDYVAHLYTAETWATYGYPDRPRPQFLFHVLVIMIYRVIPGMSIPYAGLLLALIYYVALSIILFVLVYPLFTGLSRSLNLIFAFILAIVLMVVGPINLITWSPPNLYFGYIPSHTYHNPTIALLKPFAVILFVYACRVFNPVRTSSATVLVCALVSAFGTIAKPSYAIVLVPVLGLLTLVHLWHGKSINWLLLIAGIALPIAIVLIWQQRYYRSTDMGGFIFAPLLVMTYYSANNLFLKLLLSIAFPLVVVVLYYRQALKNTSLQIAWLGLLVGVLYTYLLAESNGWQDGNFTWSGQIAVFILFIASTLFLVRQNIELFAQRRYTPAFLASVSVLVLHVVGGFALYLASFSPNWLQMM